MTSDEWQILLNEDPDNELIRFSLGKALLEEKNWKRAAVEFERLVALDPEYALAWAFLARSRLQSGDLKGAREACDKGMPIALKQKHEVPQDEIRAVLDELDSEF